MKVHTFTTRLTDINNYLPYSPPDCVEKMIIVLPDDEVKETLYHAIPNLWRKRMTKQRNYFVDGSIQEISGFFERRIENPET